MRGGLAFAAFALITLPFVSPLIDYGNLFTASYGGDSRLVIWGLAWDAHALTSGLPLFASNLYFPEADSLRFNEHFLSVALVALPFQWLGGAVFAYWVVWLLAFPLNGVAMYALAWRVTRDRTASFVGGLIYAFCFFRMHHAHGHLLLLWTWALPLLPLALERWVASPTWRHTIVVTGLVVFQSLVSGYFTALTAIVCVITAVVYAVSRPVLTRRHALRGAMAVAAGGGLVAWASLPYLSLQPGGAAEAAALSADLKGYLTPPLNTWLGQRLPSLAPREIWGDQTVYIGMKTLLLAIGGLWGWGRKSFLEDTPGVSSRNDSRPHPLRPHLAVLLTGAIALAISFGPASGWSPYDLLSQLPGFSLLRAPARLALLVMMAIALLAAIALAAIRPRLGRGYTAVVAVLAAAILFESYVVDFPGGKPKPFAIPAAYTHLTTLPAGAVLSLPAYRATPEAFRDADYLYFSTAHWRPIVNGYGRQEPPSHAALMEVVTQFPAATAVDRLRQIGVRYVIVNGERATELRPAIEAARSTPGVRTVGAFGADVLFELQ